MPPHLHPRSRFTSSLFATTLFASFFVVALPHVLPCPAPRRVYADGESPDGTRRRRRRKCVDVEKEVEGDVMGLPRKDGEESSGEEEVQRGKREGECPIPKPGGIVGQIVGFKSSNEEGKGKKPP